MALPLLMGNTLSDLGNLGYKYDETNQRNELARYMHDKLSAAEAQRGGLERQRIANDAQRNANLRELGLAPWERGMTGEQAAQIGVVKDALQNQRRNELVKGILGISAATRMTPEQFEKQRATTTENIKMIAEAKTFRDKLKLDVDRWVPDEVRAKYKEGGSEWFGGGGLWDKNAMAEANRQTLGVYGQWVNIDQFGNITPKPGFTSTLPDETARTLMRALQGDDTALNELTKGGTTAAPGNTTQTDWTVDPRTNQAVRNKPPGDTGPRGASGSWEEAPPAPGIAPGFGRF